jgi:DNA invertase Pin-like site-specific DNA recombinase
MKVYLYSRVSTDQQSTEQQERTAYEWLKCHQMKVDEIVSDEGVSGGVSFKDRNLGKILLPKMCAGDTLIVSEVSRLGRSMYDLSKLIHTELKPRKIRLICVSMGIDLRCDKMTAIDELILNNFSFAAQLEKQLISERTLSALQVKRQHGVKLGGAAIKWRESFNKKSKQQKEEEQMKKGQMKRTRHQDSRDMIAFAKVLSKVFPDYTYGDPSDWDWRCINCKEPNRSNILSLMADYKEFDKTLFVKWDFRLSSDDNAQRVRSYMQSFKRSYGVD